MAARATTHCQPYAGTTERLWLRYVRYSIYFYDIATTSPSSLPSANKAAVHATTVKSVWDVQNGSLNSVAGQLRQIGYVPPVLISLVLTLHDAARSGETRGGRVVNGVSALVPCDGLVQMLTNDGERSQVTRPHP